MMLSSGMALTAYSDTSYHIEDLKSLTRYHFGKVKERAKRKSSLSRLVTILFPEFEKLVPTLHIKSMYILLSKFPSASKWSVHHVLLIFFLIVPKGVMEKGVLKQLGTLL